MEGDNIDIRVLDLDDLALLCDAGADVFDHPVQPGLAREFLAADGHILVAAIAAGGIVGFASGTVIRHPDKRPQLFVNEVGVADAYRRRGVARDVLDRLRLIAKARGCDQMWVVTDLGNVGARALYASVGADETADLVMYDWEVAADA